jgi:hypothetical protein
VRRARARTQGWHAVEMRSIRKRAFTRAHRGWRGRPGAGIARDAGHGAVGRAYGGVAGGPALGPARGARFSGAGEGARALAHHSRTRSPRTHRLSAALSAAGRGSARRAGGGGGGRPRAPPGAAQGPPLAQPGPGPGPARSGGTQPAPLPSRPPQGRTAGLLSARPLGLLSASSASSSPLGRQASRPRWGPMGRTRLLASGPGRRWRLPRSDASAVGPQMPKVSARYADARGWRMPGDGGCQGMADARSAMADAMADAVREDRRRGLRCRGPHARGPQAAQAVLRCGRKPLGLRLRCCRGGLCGVRRLEGAGTVRGPCGDHALGTAGSRVRGPGTARPLEQEKQEKRRDEKRAVNDTRGEAALGEAGRGGEAASPLVLRRAGLRSPVSGLRPSPDGLRSP